MTRYLRRIGTGLTGVCLWATVVYGQGGSATTALSGVVVDTGGGVIPGATVVVRNQATNVAFEVITNAEGVFSVPALAVGTYSVTVSLAGFRTAVVSDLRLLAGLPGDVRVTLEVGAVTETVTVRGGTELVQTQSTAVSSTISTEQIANLPVYTRNALHFTTFLPGVDTTTGVRNSTINGLPESTINITLDGVNVNNNMQLNTDGFYSMVRPNLDAIEAVTLTGATPGAESAGSGAVQVKFVTRSGSNRFSGSGYWYHRRPEFNTNNFFNEVNNLPKNKIILHQYGGRIGGPIVIPGLVDGRNKAFFFVNHEEFFQPTEATRTRTLLHPRALAGFFRYNFTVAGVTQVREVNVLDLARANGQVSTPDATITALIAQMRSAAQTTGTINPNPDPMTEQYVFLSPGEYVEHLPTTRVDFNLGAKHRLTGTYVWQQVDRNPDIQNGDDAQYPGFPNFGNYHSYRTVGSGTLRSTFTANLVNELLVGWQWSPGYFSENPTLEHFANQGGFNLNLPFVSSATTANAPNSRNTINWNIDNTVNWQRGTHSYSFGTSFTQINHWDTTRNIVPTLSFGIQSGLDPADAMFTTANFPGASSGQLNSARSLYALLTGRITQIGGTARLNEDTNQYQYLGPRDQRVVANAVGVFAQDSWRMTPTFTLNYGLRWELQLPYYPNNATYSKATLEDICGISGLGSGPGGRGCNMFQPGARSDRRPQFVQYPKGEPGYRTDWNNVAPTGGVAWRPAVQGGWLRRILGDPDQAVVRASYSLVYNRVGAQQFTGVYGSNQGSIINANRDNTNGNLVLPGESWPVLFRERERLGPPPIPSAPSYPIFATNVNSLNIFDAAIQVPYSHSYSVGVQRSLGRNTAIEARYVGTRYLAGWTEENYNEMNVIENGFINEFKLAQRNLQANLAAGRGNTFAFTGAPGTSPLPIFLAHYTGLPVTEAGNPARYTGNSWTNTTYLGWLSLFNPNPFGFASTNSTNGLYGNSTFRNNAVRAGLPRNFWVMNPDASSANVTTNGGKTVYDSIQVELRRRMADGFQLNANYTHTIRRLTSALDTLRRDRILIRSTGDNAEIPHAFKTTWVYELPFGRGRRFGTTWHPLVNGILGNWEFDGTGRVQSGRPLTLTGVRLVGMTEEELRKEFKIRIVREAGQPVRVWTLPEDIRFNTRAAFNTDPTSPTGYSVALGPPTGRYIAPASSLDCVQAIVGDCGPRNIYVWGPIFTRLDLSLKKRFPIQNRTSFDLQLDILNVFDAINFIPVFQAGTGETINQVTSAYTDISQAFDPGGRLMQVVLRVNW